MSGNLNIKLPQVPNIQRQLDAQHRERTLNKANLIQQQAQKIYRYNIDIRDKNEQINYKRSADQLLSQSASKNQNNLAGFFHDAQIIKDELREGISNKNWISELEYAFDACAARLGSEIEAKVQRQNIQAYETNQAQYSQELLAKLERSARNFYSPNLARNKVASDTFFSDLKEYQSSLDPKGQDGNSLLSKPLTSQFKSNAVLGTAARTYFDSLLDVDKESFFKQYSDPNYAVIVNMSSIDQHTAKMFGVKDMGNGLGYLPVMNFTEQATREQNIRYMSKYLQELGESSNPKQAKKNAQALIALENTFNSFGLKNGKFGNPNTQASVILSNLHGITQYHDAGIFSDDEYIKWDTDYTLALQAKIAMAPGKDMLLKKGTLFAASIKTFNKLIDNLDDQQISALIPSNVSIDIWKGTFFKNLYFNMINNNVDPAKPAKNMETGQAMDLIYKKSFIDTYYDFLPDEITPLSNRPEAEYNSILLKIGYTPNKSNVLTRVGKALSMDPTVKSLAASGIMKKFNPASIIKENRL